MSRGRLLVVLVLFALAGCQVGTPQPDTVTPAPVPSATGEVATVDPQAVGENHRMALSDRSHTTTVSLLVSYPNGTTARLTDEFVAGADSRYRYERRIRGPYPAALSNFTVWQNDTEEFTRTTANGTATVTARSGPGFEDVSLSGFLRGLFAGFSLTAERTDGETSVTGSQTGARGVPLPAGLVAGRNATLDARIRDDIVRTATVRAQATDTAIDESVDVRLTVTVRRVGASDPTRPAWATASNVTETG